MFKPVLDINNDSKTYLAEKELFILYSLLRRERFSTWSNVFEPQSFSMRLSAEKFTNGDPLLELGKTLERMNLRRLTSVDIAYFIALGQELDKEGYSITCTANYSLVEGGFLSQYIGDEMVQVMEDYVHDSEDGRKKSAALLSQEQTVFLDKIINEPAILQRVALSALAHPPIEEYSEAILKQNADEDFIALVKKLILEPKTGDFDHGGSWTTKDVGQFLEIFYRHSKESFKKNALSDKTALYEDWQTRLAHLIFEHADFCLTIKNTDKLKNYLKSYIDLFERDALKGLSKFGLSGTSFAWGLRAPLNRKFFGCKKQKEILKKHIEKTYEEYQRNDLDIGSPYFTPEYVGDRKGNDVKVSISTDDDDDDRDPFLFVHAMLALEHEKYLTIEGLSYGTAEVFDLYDRGFLFQIVLSNEGKETSQNLFDGYDEKHHILKLAGQEIELSKKGRVTNAVLLFETLFKEDSTDWVHNDEILEDWGCNDVDLEESSKNKIYFAGKKINTAVALKTQIEDFIECNTSKARINPKYRKVDE